MKTKIAIIGMGFVGGAIHSSFLNNTDVELLQNYTPKIE